MNRTSVIKHIIAEAKGNPILSEQYELSAQISPLIKSIRGLIEKAKGKLKTVKSIASRIESGKLSRDYLEDVKGNWLELNHIFTKMFELRNEMAKHVQAAFENEVTPSDLAKEVISNSYRHISNSQGTSRRGYKYCCSESPDSTIQDAELCELNMDELSKSLYNITKGMLY
jgi:hypothetical protein